jgi:hypothetical protein
MLLGGLRIGWHAPGVPIARRLRSRGGGVPVGRAVLFGPLHPPRLDHGARPLRGSLWMRIGRRDLQPDRRSAWRSRVLPGRTDDARPVCADLGRRSQPLSERARWQRLHRRRPGMRVAGGLLRRLVCSRGGDVSLSGSLPSRGHRLYAGSGLLQRGLPGRGVRSFRPQLCAARGGLYEFRRLLLGVLLAGDIGLRGPGMSDFALLSGPTVDTGPRGPGMSQNYACRGRRWKPAFARRRAEGVGGRTRGASSTRSPRERGGSHSAMVAVG